MSSAVNLLILSAPPETLEGEPDPYLFKRAGTWWLVLSLFLIADGGGLFTTHGVHLSVPGAVEESASNLLLLTAMAWAIGTALMFNQIGLVIRTMIEQKLVLSFATLAILSTLWSQAPQLTFRKSIILFLYLVFAWFFTTYYAPVDQARILTVLGFVMAVGSILWVVLFPRYGLQATGEWKGIFTQKNGLGEAMFYLFAGLPFHRIASVRKLLTLILQASLPLGLILLSQSRTSLIMVLVVVAIRLVGPAITNTRREKLPLLLYFVAVSAAIVPLVLGFFLPLLGRDMSFTGRINYWGFLVPLALRHFWLGSGYQAFFVDGSGAAGPVFLGSTLGNIYSADNGYLDVMLQFGVLGLALFFLLVIFSVRDFMNILRMRSVPILAYWYAGLLAATLIGSVTENLLWKPIRITPFILTVACAGLWNLSRAHAHMPEQLVTIGSRSDEGF